MGNYFTNSRFIRYIGISVIILLISLGIFSIIRSLTKQYDSGSIYGQSIVTVSPDTFEAWITREDIFLLDVRSKEEFDEGHIIGAEYLDPDDLDRLDKQLSLMDPTKTYVMYCYGGRRSLELSQRMVEIGFGDIILLDGGFEAWLESGKPSITTEEESSQD